MLTLVDKFYHRYLCVTWFYYVGKKTGSGRMESLADLRMNHQAHEPKQCWTFAELASLCSNTRWKVVLSFSKCHEDMATLFERFVQDVKMCSVVVMDARLTFLHCLDFVRMQSNRRTTQQGFCFLFIKGGWLKLPFLPFKLGHTNIVLKHVSQENICLLVMNLTFKSQMVWPGTKL